MLAPRRVPFRVPQFMSVGVSIAAVRALGLAVFQRDARGHLRLTGDAPKWLRALWPQAARPSGVLRPGTSAFLENFLVDAAGCWKAGGSRQIRSGWWVEPDAGGTEHRLDAIAFSPAGRATLVVIEAGPLHEEQTVLLQKARELALAYEKLRRAEQALAEEKRLLAQRVRERTAELSEANATLKQEIIARQRFAERLQAEHDLNKAILAEQSPEAIAKVALRRLRRWLPCDDASLLELDPDHQRASVLASLRGGRVTSDGHWLLSREQLEKCHALKSGCLHQVRNRPNLFANPASGGAAASRVWPLIVDVPLIAEEALVGILNLAIGSSVRFTAEHEEIALEAAAQLAVALREARLFAEVAAGREQLRALSSKLVEVQEAERRFLAHELHDEIGQALTGLKLTLEMSRRMVADPPDATFTEAIVMVDDLMQRVRQLSLDLRPQMLDDLGLLPALDWLFKRQFKQAGFSVHFKHTPLTGRLPTQLETAVFRIVQEALTNVVRHAGVREVAVRLWRDGRNRTLGVQVHDTGAGFDVPQVLGARASSGLAGMRERATLLGGQFTLESKPGAGTRLTVELPLAPERSKPSTPTKDTR